MNLRQATWVIGTIWLGLAARTPTPNPALALLHSGCQPPCWHGIVPGTTTLDETLEIIPRIPQASETSPGVREEGQGRKYVRCVLETGRKLLFLELITAHDTVSALELSLDGEVTLEELFLAYGEPDAVGGFWGRGERYWRRVFLLFNEGMAASLHHQGRPKTDTWRLRPADEVWYLFFYDPGSLYQLVEDRRLLGDLAPDGDALIAASRPWEGYSTIDLMPAYPTDNPEGW